MGDVVVLDIRPPSNPKMQWVVDPVWKKITFVEASVSDDFPALLKTCKDNKVERIFHAAAIFRAEYENEHPYYSFHVNIEGMLNVCEAARILGLGRVVFAGTNGEYAESLVNQDPTPLDPETARMFSPVCGASPYSASKMASTIIGMSYWQYQGVDWVGTRFSRVWGFGSKPETTQNVPRMVENAVDGIPTKITEGLGDQKRCETYAKDLARGVIIALDIDSKRLKHRVFNVGGPEETSENDAAKIVKEFIPDAQIEIKSGGVNRRKFSNKLAEKELGWKPEYDLRRMIKDYIETYREFKKTKHS